VEGISPGPGGQPGSVSIAASGGGSGRSVAAGRAIVVATDAPAAEALLGEALEASPSKRDPGVGTCNLYFRSECCSSHTVHNFEKGSSFLRYLCDLRWFFYQQPSPLLKGLPSTIIISQEALLLPSVFICQFLMGRSYYPGVSHCLHH
jgi:hypothetical protein